MGTPRIRFRAPAPKSGARRFKVTPDTDPVRADLLRICALRDADPATFAVESRAFVERNMGLAWAFCESLECRHVPLADLVQVAAMGLMEAIKRFDPSKAGKFSTYAVWWLRHSVGQYLLKAETLVTIPDDLLAIRREVDWLERDGIRRQHYEILAHLGKKKFPRSQKPRFVGVTGAQIEEARALYLGHTHKAVDHRKIVAAEGEPLDVETTIALREAIDALPPRLRAVIAEEYGGGTGAVERGAALRLSPVAKDHMRTLALRKLREALSG